MVVHWSFPELPRYIYMETSCLRLMPMAQSLGIKHAFDQSWTQTQRQSAMPLQWKSCLVRRLLGIWSIIVLKLRGSGLCVVRICVVTICSNLQTVYCKLIQQRGSVSASQSLAAELEQVSAYPELLQAPKTCENFRCLVTGEKGKGKSSGKPLHYKVGARGHEQMNNVSCRHLQKNHECFGNQTMWWPSLSPSSVVAVIKDNSELSLKDEVKSWADIFLASSFGPLHHYSCSDFSIYRRLIVLGE